ncbi:SlyX family protein [Sulfurisoma sediminicola]|jgi:SlyX protein|uniref:SlyX protein n=1 Tax=Sulfurisoma sediminicola TaxID=1381557 RepID=A0A497XEP3_9PROT|nr:SlyX family protein [Sulfurisoma sediminicola]RLJ64647.1 SlyX protein [Sulfurisoma sediminicola]
MDARINELEVKLSFAEDLLEQLNLTVFRQQQQIEGLQRELRALREQMLASMPAESRSLRDEIPPHY